MADAALERQVSGRQASGRQVSGAYRGLRGWLDMVEHLGELKRVSGAHWDVEMGAVTHMLTEKSGGMAPAILFDDVPGYRKGYRTLYGQLSSVKRIALTLGLPLEHERKVDIVQRYHARMQDLKPLPPRYVNDGPIFENVIEGDTVDVLNFRCRAITNRTKRALSAPPIASSPRIRQRLVQSRRLSQSGLRRQDRRLPDHRGQAWPHPPRQIFCAWRADESRHPVRPGPVIVHARV